MLFLALGTNAQQTARVYRTTEDNAVKETAQLKVKAIDTSKVRFFAGEGSNVSYLAVRWNDGAGADNLIWGYRWNEADSPTGETMLNAIAKADPRLYIMVAKTTFGTTVGGFGFDLDGSGKVAVKNSNGQFEPKDGVISLKSTYFDGYSPVDPSDHWKSGWGSGKWKYYAADDINSDGEYYGTSGSSRTLVNGSFDVWSFESFEEYNVEADYNFYVPTTEEGIYLPEEITLPISDNGTSLPVIISSNGKSIGNMTWTIQDENGNADNSIITSISSENSKVNADVTLTNAKGTAAVSVRCQLGDGSTELQSNTCKVSIGGPQKPITGISFENAEIEIGLNKTATNTITLSPSNATYTRIRYESSNKDIATVKDNGEVTSYTTEGETTITAVSLADENVKGSYTVKVKCQKPVESITFEGGNTVELNIKDIFSINPTIAPEDADYKEVAYEIEDTEIANFYNNNIIALKAGETTLTVTALDKQGAKAEIKIVVKETDRDPYNEYKEGIFILNEGWFGHENGSMNFVTVGGEMIYRVYERENPEQALGATTCYGTVYGDKIFVMSKQAADMGDAIPGGGRLVIMDAKTLKRVAAFEELGGGDGRSIVGATPEKMYVGTSKGILPLDLEKLELGSVIAGTEDYQTGDMLKAGKYVFALQQNKGVNVIEIETNTVKSVIGDANTQGIVQSADGDIWLGSNATLIRIDPETLETKETLDLPEGAEITCAWGSWRPTPFCASNSRNLLFWAGGTDAWNTGNNYYRYEIGTDISTLKPFFSVADMDGASEGKKQTSYGIPRFDDRTDELIVLTTQEGWGTNYEYNWVHFVNGETGAVNSSIELKQNYWFQAMPVLPDKYAAELSDDVSRNYTIDVSDQPLAIDLTDKITDRDNVSYNISKSVTTDGDGNIVKADITGNTLTLTPVAKGSDIVTITMESNGLKSEAIMNINVTNLSGIDQTEYGRNISVNNGILYINGYKDYDFAVINAGGQIAGYIHADSDNYRTEIELPRGIYILKGNSKDNAVTVKIINE